MPLMLVRSRAEQVKVLWAMVKASYDEATVHDTLDNLTEEMIKVPAKAPKQRGKATQVRHLLPFAARLAGSFDGMDQHWQTVARMTKKRLALRPYPKHESAELSRNILFLYNGLEIKAVANRDQVEGEAKVTLDARVH